MNGAPRARRPGRLRRIGSGLLACCLFSAAALATKTPGAITPARHRAGPPPGHTGGFGEPTCHACHWDNDADAGAGAITVHDFPATWSPGRTYAFEIVLRHTGLGRAGFQATLRFADGGEAGRNAGRMHAATGTTTLTGTDTGVTYVQHLAEGTLPLWPDSAGWRVTWTAPEHGGRVTLHVAANAANNDDSPLGDFVYTATRSSEPGEKTAVRERSRPPTGKPAPSTPALWTSRHRP